MFEKIAERLQRFRRFILSVNVQAQDVDTMREVRRGLVGFAHRLKTTKDFAADMSSFGAIISHHERETSTWIGSEEIVSGAGGPFDSRELRVYLALAERAGVPIVPAREILRLTEDEFDSVGRPIPLPNNAVMRGIRSRLIDFLGANEAELSDKAIDRENAKVALSRSVAERAMDAMDDVPEGWMVRSNLCGPSTLKALAGCGVAGPQAPEVAFGPDLEIGPGWVRVGNGRRVDVTDMRFVSAAARGARGDAHAFLARPWVRASRFLTCDDPHRVDTPAAGKGTWPAEWRAFVEGGKVRGVSFYYSWAGEATPENARIAIEVARLAQSVADEATRIGAWPRAMDVEFVRESPFAADDPKAAELLRRFPRDGVAFTLDFVETDEGLKVLEGGPAHTPLGMGHSCGFTGVIDPFFGNCMLVDGVAFRTLPGVSLIDTTTWKDAGPHEGCVLTWEETTEIARDDSTEYDRTTVKGDARSTTRP